MHVTEEFCRVLVELLLLLLVQKSRFGSWCLVDALLQTCPAVLVYSIYSLFLRRCWETQKASGANENVLLQEVEHLCNVNGLQVLSHNTKNGKKSNNGLWLQRHSPFLFYFLEVLLLSLLCNCCHFNLHQSRWKWLMLPKWTHIYPWSLTDSTIYFHDPVFPFIKTTSHDVVLLVPVLIATWWIVLWTNQLQHLGNKVCRLLFVSYTVSKLIVVQGGTNSEPETVSCVGSKCNVQQVHLTDNYSRKKMFKIRIRMRSLLIKCAVDFILHSVLYVFCKSDEGYILYQQ